MGEQAHNHQSLPGDNLYTDPRMARNFRRRCESLVRHLPIPAPFDEWAFCAALGERRGRSIILHPWPLRHLIPGEEVVSGFVDVEHDRDVIYYERDTRRLHQQQIVAHEAAHLILGHQGDGITPATLVAELQQIAPQSTIRHVHRRAGARSREEFEAETLGRMILSRANSSSAQLALKDPDAALLLDMLEGLDGYSS